MGRPLSRAKRKYPGEAEGRMLATWLNALRDDTERSQRLEDWNEWYAHFALMALFEKEHTGLPVPAGVSLPVDLDVRVTIEPDGSFVARSDAAMALIAARDLVRKGKRNSVRTCKNERCAKWFFARFENQTFCSAKCQQQWWKSTDRYRAYMRKKQRQYRAIRKKLEEGRARREAREGRTVWRSDDRVLKRERGVA
jgi:hypothetical protein